MSGPPLVVLKSLSKSYAGMRVVDGVDLSIYQGDFVSISGPSGSGKSTLLNMVGLLDRADSGSYVLDGTDVEQLTERERDRIRGDSIGFVFQSAHALAGRSVAKNVELPLSLARVPVQGRPALVKAALVRAGIEHRASHRASLTSGGELQRAAIARALVREPRMLLLDEPTGSLDTVNTTQMILLLQRLNTDGVTIVVVTHDPVLAAAACRQLELVEGRMRECVRGGT